MKRRDAPCKINLALDILGRREDGYHELRTVMQTVSLCDTVSVEEGTVPGVELLSDFTPEPGKKTLEERAAEAFFRSAGLPPRPLRVQLRKVTPAYAGLGGGSADVAALLRLLREEYAPDLSTEALERVGLEVGSDMPFCVRGGTALAEGRGEILTDLPPLPPCEIVVCKPDFGIPTPALFALADSAELWQRPDIGGMLEALSRGDLPGVASRVGNVFEEVLPPEYGEVFTIRGRLLELGALGASMSGSGPAVFGLFAPGGSAAAAARELGRTWRETFLARPVGRLDDEPGERT